MNPEPSAEVPALDAASPVADPAPALSAPLTVPRWLVLLLAALSLLALLTSGLLWQKLSSIQELLARQSADTAAQSTEARAVARQAQELAREAAARVAVFDARLSEVALQRTQLEELMQSLSRSRDENMVVDIEAAIRLAQQQAQLTGSVEPLLAALKSADQRVARAAQPRLTPLQRAIARDIDRIKSAAVSDTPGLLVKLDELVHLADELVPANAVLPMNGGVVKRAILDAKPSWWQRSLQVVLDEANALLRVSRIEQPEAALLSPEQSFFLRENFKLKLLNARLGLLARQLESSRADLAAATMSLNKYFDPTSRKTQIAATLLQQVQTQMKTLQLPRVDETLTALTTAAAGR
ncbi:MAG: uroporphyrinogen-III C-methyltransferase [Rhodoferax sp.]|uniref:uroporphyrinogen-III C-methyltransferase n=1 Tax=Rhodoferax sp. TaxID=50421 RepID=UPI00262895BC|nr:uroporphyrinogen-III C-methyltransferase [Rhodoferax sp.]MDD5333078.1 uroporphyrinogen-III C-methyltransferase [Rhodoferax sp.]